jgi:hypothetical protein
VKLWRSGIIWTALSFLAGLGNLACSAIIGHHLAAHPGEFGHGNTALDFVTFLGLPLQMLNMSVVHYIAHFRSRNDDARLQGLLAGCQKLLFWGTVFGSLVAISLWQPMGRFFHFERETLMLAVLICGLVGCWSGFGIALCQGMAWFKRMAVIGLVVVSVRILFAYFMTKRYPTAEVALSATTVAMMANFILFYWWKSIFHHPAAQTVSPWNREFLQFLLVTGATVAGNYFFTSGDGLVSNKYFARAPLDAFQTAARLGRAIPATVLPLLIVTFTSRSGSREGAARTDQRILIALYAVGLACGAALLILFRSLLVRVIIGRSHNPDQAMLLDDAARMIVPFSIAMAFIGLNQAIGMWSLADRTFRIALLYGLLGLAYWTTLLVVGKTPAALLWAMPIAAAIAFCILSVSWFANRARLRASP